MFGILYVSVKFPDFWNGIVRMQIVGFREADYRLVCLITVVLNALLFLQETVLVLNIIQAASQYCNLPLDSEIMI